MLGQALLRSARSRAPSGVVVSARSLSMSPVRLDDSSSRPRVLVADPIQLATPLYKQLSNSWDVVVRHLCSPSLTGQR